MPRPRRASNESARGGYRPPRALTRPGRGVPPRAERRAADPRSAHASRAPAPGRSAGLGARLAPAACRPSRGRGRRLPLPARGALEAGAAQRRRRGGGRLQGVERGGPPGRASGGMSAMYDEQLADRIRVLSADEPGLTEKKMFGGLAFLVNGNMAVAASGQGGLLVRVDPTETEQLLAEPGTERMQMGKRAPMDGWLRVGGDVTGDNKALRAWVKRGVAYAH